MLSRRIPIPSNQPPVRAPQQQQQAHQPVSALPPHLQRSATVTGHTSQPPTRPNTPPHRSASPFRNRPMSVPPRPQSPSLTIASAAHPSVAADPVDVDLVVRSIPRGALPVDRPFRVTCTLGVAASVREGQRRTLSLAVQHVQLSVATAAAAAAATTTTIAPAPRNQSTIATAIAPPSSSPAPRAAALALLDGPVVSSPRTTHHAEQQQQQQQDEEDDPPSASRLHIPPPEPIPGDERRYEKLRGATRFLGASTLLVSPMTLFAVRATSESSAASSGSGSAGDDKDDAKVVGGAQQPPGGGGGGGGGATRKEERFWDFELEYAPLRTGFVPVGGLRVLLLEDRVDGMAEAYSERRAASAPVVLREWDVIGEIWVKS